VEPERARNLPRLRCIRDCLTLFLRRLRFLARVGATAIQAARLEPQAEHYSPITSFLRRLPWEAEILTPVPAADEEDLAWAALWKSAHHLLRQMAAAVEKAQEPSSPPIQAPKLDFR
jgi:hypothetical protein